MRRPCTRQQYDVGIQVAAVPAGYQPDSCNVSPDRRFIACANKGSTFWGDHCPDHNLDGPECDLAKADLPASITVLEMDPNDPKKVLNFGTYQIPPDRFDADDLLLNNFVRLYGPSARYPHLDLSPADAVISEDNVVYVNFQDNNAVGAFSIADRDTPDGGWKWVQGYGFPKFTGDLAADGEVHLATLFTPIEAIPFGEGMAEFALKLRGQAPDGLDQVE